MWRTMEDPSLDDISPDGSRKMAILVCLFASLGGIFFGYDQGVTSGVLIMDSFRNDTSVLASADGTLDLETDSGWLTFTMVFNTLYNVGCVLGALMGGMVADKYGRRGTIFMAGLLFCLGTTGVCIVPAGRDNRWMFFIARLVQGLGTGNSSFSLPLFGAEVSPKELRGFLSGFMQMMIVTGLLIATAMNLTMQNWKGGWRVVNAVAIIPAFIVMVGIWFVPESPRWVYLHKGVDQAEGVLQRLRLCDDVTRELRAIGIQVARDGSRESEWKDLLRPSIYRRVVVAMLVQFLVQATGINAMFTYGGIIFSGIFKEISKSFLAVFFLSVVNFLSTIPAMWWVDTTGRRQLLLLGAIGMTIGHLVSAMTYIAGCNEHPADGGLPCTHLSTYFILGGTAFFVFNFAFSWGPIGWIYPAEIFPLSVRAKAVSLSTVSNWTMGTIMTLSLQSLEPLTVGGLFLLFSMMCVGCGTMVFYYCPETKGILLEDVEELFHRSTYDSKYISIQSASLDGSVC